LKNTMKIIGKEIYNKKINYGDDRLINFLLFKRAKSFISIAFKETSFNTSSFIIVFFCWSLVV
jgi:hypothetical protein